MSPALKRLQAEFVECFDIQQGVTGTKDIANAKQRIQSLFLFPEGTFTRVSGLQNFRMGAFITAAEANMQRINISCIIVVKWIFRIKHPNLKFNIHYWILLKCELCITVKN